MNTPDEPTIEHTTAGDGPGARTSARRRGLVIGGAAGIIGGGLVGLALTLPSFTDAASGTEGPVAEVTVAEVTVADESDPEQPGSDDTAEHTARLREALQALVDDGTITADQADAVAAHLVAEAPHRGGPEGRRGPGHGPGIDVDVDVDVDGPHAGPRGPHGPAPEVLAEALGIDVAELGDRIRDGETVAEIAEANGVDLQNVIDVLVAEAQAHLDDEVAEGDLTEEEAAARLAEMTERITARVNGEATGTD